MKTVRLIVATLLLVCCCQQVGAEEKSAARFTKIGDSIVLDNKSGLMWAAHDNGKDIDWYDAEKYCNEFEAGGYTDWRLPDIKELTTLYTSGRKNKQGFFIIDKITLTDCCPWSADTAMGGASVFSFKSGKKPFAYFADSYQARALPVRTHTKPDTRLRLVKKND